MSLAHEHDHALCMETAIERAVLLCARRGVRLTDTRRHILELVWQRHEPVTAYDLVETLRQVSGRRVDPPTVYRALDFLMEQGLVHRIEGLNAFIGCTMPEARHSSQFLICRLCGTISEMTAPEIVTAVESHAGVQGFVIEHQTIEAYGLCAQCRAQKSGD